MKLYIKPGACSLGPHIALREAGLPVEPIKVDLAAKKLEGGGDYLAINPKGQVPALVLETGEVLTEASVMLQYIADQAPASGLLPRTGMARYRTLESLHFCASELHKNYSPLFRPNTPDAYKPVAREILMAKLGHLDQQLQDRSWLAGEDFSIADCYAFVMLFWARHLQFDLSALPRLDAFGQRVGERPAVQQALTAEGLA